MARQRSPNRDKAFEIYKDHNGNIDLVDIAEQLDIPAGTVRGWKNKDRWDEQIFGAFQKNNTERSNKKKSATKKAIAKEVKQVMENPDLTDKQRLFCLYYSRSFNATRSYQKAYGVDYLTACANGPRLLGNDRVKEEITRLKEQRYAKELLRPEDIFQKYMDIAFADITDYLQFGREEVPVMGPFGPVAVKDEVTGEKRVITKEINVVKFKESAEIDGTILAEVKQGRDGASIKLHDRMKALQWLADHMDMATEEQMWKIERMKAEVDKIKEGKGDTNIRVTIVDDIEGDTDED